MNLLLGYMQATRDDIETDDPAEEGAMGAQQLQPRAGDKRTGNDIVPEGQPQEKKQKCETDAPIE